MIPTPLYKVFDNKKYAEQFINEGNLRFSTLGYYKKIEDRARVDCSEGFGKVSKDGESFLLDSASNSVSLVPGIETLYVEGGELGRL